MTSFQQEEITNGWLNSAFARRSMLVGRSLIGHPSEWSTKPEKKCLSVGKQALEDEFRFNMMCHKSEPYILERRFHVKHPFS